MADQMNKRQLFYRETEDFIKMIRNSLFDQAPALPLLTASVDAVTVYITVAIGADVDSFRSIADRLQIVLARHLTDKTMPNKIELETFELAVDWLDQLAILYVENLPEPKSLVAELLYTFDLVESSHDAESLAELVAEHAEPGKNSRVDPFLEDPEFNIEDRPLPSRCDPFADDPGFGLEFDLLQRTMNFAGEARNIGEDPFRDDPSVEPKGSS